MLDNEAKECARMFWWLKKETLKKAYLDAEKRYKEVLKP